MASERAPTPQTPVAETKGSAWLSPTIITVLAAVMLCALQLFTRLYDASEEADGQAALALALIEQHAPAPHTIVEQISGESLAKAVASVEAVQSLGICHSGACTMLYAKPGAALCSSTFSTESVCGSARSIKHPGDELFIAEDITPILKSAGIDMVIILMIAGVVMVLWHRALALVQDDYVPPAQFKQASENDPLTGLLNRVTFEAAVKKHNDSKGARSSEPDGCLLYFDLDRFKIINDTHGHIAGDTVLKTVTERLRYVLGNKVIIGRLGGDEFAALMTDVGSKANIETMCRVLIEQVSKPIQLDQVKDWVGLSIGAYMLKRGEMSVGELLHRADLAMYEAKRAGRGRVVFYDESMSEAARSKAQIQADLRVAIEERQLFMVYQPQFDIHDRIRGVESMVQWKHPSRGLIAPDVFIPIAEQSGLIVPLGKLIIDLVCSDLVTLRAQRLALPYVSMDVSLRQLADAAMVDDVQDALKRYGLSSTDIEFEVTESTAMVGQVGKENSTLKMLSALSFRIAIDDFGTGYSSMGRLLDLKVDKLKIDAVFVQAIGKSNFNPALLELMIALANRLGVKSVAEGVETADQVAWLRKAGCQMMQGNFFARPMTHAQLVNWLKLKEGDNDFEQGVWSPTQTMEFGDDLDVRVDEVHEL